MSPTHVIFDAVTRMQSHVARVAFVRYAARALLLSLLLGSGLVFVVPVATLGSVVALVGVAALGFAVIAASLAQPSELAAAKQLDDAYGAKDRLSSSIQLIRDGAAGDPMVAQLLAEAAALARVVEPARVAPMKMPRECYLLPLPILLTLGFLLLPAWVTPADARAEVVRETLEAQAMRIADYVAYESSRSPSTGKRRVLARLEKLAAELTRKKISKKDAMAELAKLMKELDGEKEEERKKREELRRLIRNFQTNEKNRDLADSLNKGNYQDAANRVKRLLEELRRKAKKLAKKKHKTKAEFEELRKLREAVKKLEDVEARLVRLMNLQMDMNMRGEVIDFLKDVEGDLAELPEEEVEDQKFMRLGDLNQPNQGGQQGKVRRLKGRQLARPGQNAGRDTMEEFQGDEEKRTDNEREEHKLKIREGKGQSSFTQTQVANDGSRSEVEAKEVYQAERKAAEETMQRQEIPAGYREYLRRYFDGIQPDTGKRRKR